LLKLSPAKKERMFSPLGRFIIRKVSKHTPQTGIASLSLAMTLLPTFYEIIKKSFSS